MKCLSVMQPWASLIILGVKRYEVRSWATRHRGLLAIHACRAFPDLGRHLCREEPYRSIIRRAGYESWIDFPRGAVLGTVQIVNCVLFETLRAAAKRELALGNYRPGRWAWKLAGPCPWPQPLPRSGMVGIFDIPDISVT